jgi:hypothetical protein
VADTKNIDESYSLAFPTKTNPGSIIMIWMGSGKKNDVPAAVFELIARSDMSKPDFKEVEDIVTWFDSAHRVIKEVFQLSLNEKLKERMDPKREVRTR